MVASNVVVVMDFDKTILDCDSDNWVVDKLGATECDLKIVSDANVFFIDTILKHHGLKECFSEINTNPSFVDEEGRLRSSLSMISLNIPMDILILALQTWA
ncbi:hypothetical protein Gorai_005498, partial [Gossypium raimondii]|nr:hypothetical protein [Gossypium raimondii]